MASNPKSPKKGQMYFNTSDGTYRIYNGSDWLVASKLRIYEGRYQDRPCLIFSSFNRAYHLYDEDVRKEGFFEYAAAAAILYVFNGHFCGGEEYQYAKDTIMAAVVERQRCLT